MEPAWLQKIAMKHIAEVTTQEAVIELNLRCNVCGYTYARANALKSHLKMHANFPYICSEISCLGAFQTMHIESVEGKKIICKVKKCREMLPNLAELKVHYQRVHEVDIHAVDA